VAERQFRGFLENLALAMAAPVEQEVMPPLLVRLVLPVLLVVRAKWLFGGKKNKKPKEKKENEYD
jgi:hypothetical protein